MNERNPFDPPQPPVSDTKRPHDGIGAAIRRPKAIDLAFWLIIGSGALGVLSFVIGGARQSPYVFALVMLFLTGLAALIRLGKNWARIVFAVFFAFGLLSYLFAHELFAQNGVLYVGIFVLQTMLQGYALWLTFRPPGKSWFKRA